MSLFRPKIILNKFTEFDAIEYYKKGYRLVLLDIDNTIAIPSVGGMDTQARNFIDSIKNSGMKVIILSNGSRSRVKMFVEDYDIKWYSFACKPFPFAFWIACLKAKVNPKNTIVMGDQLITDILGANLSKCYGIYCKQLQEKDTFLTTINRSFEKKIWKRLNEKM